MKASPSTPPRFRAYRPSALLLALLLAGCSTRGPSAAAPDQPAYGEPTPRLKQFLGSRAPRRNSLAPQAIAPVYNAEREP